EGARAHQLADADPGSAEGLRAPRGARGSDQGGREYPGVSLEIRELAPDLIDDYLAFFDDDAFADFQWWSACYCRFWDDPSDPEGESGGDRRERYRALVTQLIQRGRHRGLLAYADGRVVGWCNAKARLAYTMPRRIAQTPATDADGVGSTVCFIVAKDHRGKGVASALLDAACASFRRDG